MKSYTFGQMLEAIELGQVAEAEDGIRRMKLTSEGMVWLTAPYSGRIVEVRGYLLSDVWTISEDEANENSAEEREQWRRKRTEMLENQWLERRARRFSPPDIEE